jgi:hypothetical protein
VSIMGINRIALARPRNHRPRHRDVVGNRLVYARDIGRVAGGLTAVAGVGGVVMVAGMVLKRPGPIWAGLWTALTAGLLSAVLAIAEKVITRYQRYKAAMDERPRVVLESPAILRVVQPEVHHAPIGTEALPSGAWLRGPYGSFTSEAVVRPDRVRLVHRSGGSPLYSRDAYEAVRRNFTPLSFETRRIVDPHAPGGPVATSIDLLTDSTVGKMRKVV